MSIKYVELTRADDVLECMDRAFDRMAGALDAGDRKAARAAKNVFDECFDALYNYARPGKREILVKLMVIDPSKGELNVETGPNARKI